MALSKSLETIPGTRLLLYTFGLIGETFTDPLNPYRNWSVVNELLPITRTEQVRLRVIDQLGFSSVIHQGDFKLLRGEVKPGDLDPWTMDEFPEVGDYKHGWRGLGMEEEDLEDDLHIRELELRQSYGWNALPTLELTRYVHINPERDEQRIDILLWDTDPCTGVGPDSRIETLQHRWSQAHREVIAWR